MKTNDVAFGPVYLSSYLPLKYPTHFLSLRSNNYAKRKVIEINEMDLHFLTYFLVADTFKCIIGKFEYKKCL